MDVDPEQHPRANRQGRSAPLRNPPSGTWTSPAEQLIIGAVDGRGGPGHSVPHLCHLSVPLDFLTNEGAGQ